MKVLVINSGSSSLKYTLYETEGEKRLAKGLVECIGLPEAYYKHQVAKNEEIKESCVAKNHINALTLVLNKLMDPAGKLIANAQEIGCVGHRVVHGGEKFSKPVLINEEVLNDIRACSILAPLHNPQNIQGIEACQSLLPGVPQVAIFDTAFHQTIPNFAFLYALPYAIYEKQNIRRYGFHGTSHEYVAQRAASMLGRPFNELKLITCHLGNGCSIAAIENGKSVDTSMGLTPLEGLVMGTRCGDVDPAIVMHLIENEKMTSPEVNTLLNKKSGLYGLSGLTNDMRTVLNAASAGSERAKIAVEVFCYRARKYIASYLGVLNGADAVVFTAGVGENCPTIREKIVLKLSNLGIDLDPEANMAPATGERTISIAGSRVKLLVIPTNEELMISRQAINVLTNK
jgi:acetate kinase